MAAARRSVAAAIAFAGPALWLSSRAEADSGPGQDEGDVRLRVLNSPGLKALFTVIRAKDTSSEEFSRTADRLFSFIVEESLAFLPGVTPRTVETPCGTFEGLSTVPPQDIAIVSIMRAGDSLGEAFRQRCPGAVIGRVLIQRDESTKEKQAVLMYSKLPPNIVDKKAVLLVDPMLASGGSACKAIRVLLSVGIPEDRIVFASVVACPEGIARLQAEHPRVRILAAAVDPGLNESKYIVPGLGDFGDRYYGTERV